MEIDSEDVSGTGARKNGSETRWEMLGSHQVIMCGLRYPNVLIYLMMGVHVCSLVLHGKEWIHLPLSPIA